MANPKSTPAKQSAVNAATIALVNEVLAERSEAFSIYGDPIDTVGTNLVCTEHEGANNTKYLKFSLPGMPNEISASLLRGTTLKTDSNLYDIVIVAAKNDNKERNIKKGIRAFRAVGAQS